MATMTLIQGLPTFNQNDWKATMAALSQQKVFFVQIGAMDGMRFDPIYPYVTRYGWHGLLVEPVPDMFALLQMNYAGCDGLIFENCAIAEKDGTATLHRIDPQIRRHGVDDWVLGITSLYPDRGVMRPGILKEREATLLKEHLVKIEVPALTLPSLLAKHAVEKIDLLQIDVEGADWMVLSQLDFARYRPKIIRLEYAHLSPQECETMIRQLQHAGYRPFLQNEQQVSEDILFVAA